LIIILDILAANFFLILLPYPFLISLLKDGV
jgi:hypothetical protein